MGKPTTRQNPTQTNKFSPPNSPKKTSKRQSKPKPKPKPKAKTSKSKKNIFSFNAYMQKRHKEKRADPEYISLQNSIINDMKNRMHNRMHNIPQKQVSRHALPLTHTRNLFPGFFPDNAGKLNKTRRKKRHRRK